MLTMKWKRLGKAYKVVMEEEWEKRRRRSRRRSRRRMEDGR